MSYSFPKLVNDILATLPKNDYPVLNTRLFFECWLGFVMDKSLTSMRDMFKRLNIKGISVDISTFSKASKNRSQEPFIKIYSRLAEKVQKRHQLEKYPLCPIDSTVITLTSKLLCQLGYSQVKLVSILNLKTGVLEDNLVNFGDRHDYNYGQEMVESLPETGIAVMDRGFASLEFLKNLSVRNKYFVIRIGQNYKLRFEEGSELMRVGTGKESGLYRVVNFCDLETRKEYRLVTNLPFPEEGGFTNEEVAEIYRKRWGIEVLWKFLKSHLKLDELITKNVNGIGIQIYVALIAYLILQLITIPSKWGHQLIDKFRYLQACMCEEISYIHWMEKIMKC